jgi:hypothetical protein
MSVTTRAVEDDLEACVRHQEDLVRIVSTPAFRAVVDHLVALPSSERRHQFVRDVIIHRGALESWGVNLPPDVTVQRSAFSDERPTLFCVTKCVRPGLKVTITFDE